MSCTTETSEAHQAPPNKALQLPSHSVTQPSRGTVWHQTSTL
jgi:hypothetical protein